MTLAIGIDLGTTNSCAAVVDDQGPRVLTYPDGSKTIPSVFAIDKAGKALTGEEAKAQAVANPSNTVTSAKRLIGRTFDSDAVQQMSQVFTYELAQGSESEVLVRVAGQVLTLEQISAAILTRIKANAEEQLGEPIDQAVITVPAYFNDRQRQAVRAAGDLAGLEVLRVLNEPTAAALAYGLGRTLDQRVAIYDLGGGTFDISIIDIKDKVFEVVATGGDTFLGGVDFDDRVMQHVLRAFFDEHNIDLSYDRSAITRIRDASEQAKIALSSEIETHIFLEHVCNSEEDDSPVDLSMHLSRSELEELTGDLVDRSLRTVERIFHEAGTTRHQIDELLLVGGQSRMPLVRDQLSDFLGRSPSHKVHPDEAVAIGAAVMAASLARQQEAGDNSSHEPDVTLHDVLPVPIGIAKPDGSVTHLFAKHQPLPTSKRRTITTSKNDQASIVLRMVQGESTVARRCELLGAFVFHGLRKAPRGQVRVEVEFAIDAEGILDLTAVDLGTGDIVESRIRLSGEDPTPPPIAPLGMTLPSALADDDQATQLIDLEQLKALGGDPDALPDRSQRPAPPPLPELDPDGAATDPGVAEPRTNDGPKISKKSTRAGVDKTESTHSTGGKLTSLHGNTPDPALASLPDPGTEEEEYAEDPPSDVPRDPLRAALRRSSTARPAPVVSKPANQGVVARLIAWFKGLLGR